MCGIFAIINKDSTQFTSKQIQDASLSGMHRGPEQTYGKTIQQVEFFFHRLAINGIDSISMQPISINNVTLICNGEIYNYKELYKLHPQIKPTTNSDCEIIIHMYLLYGMKRTLQMLDGVFAFVLHHYDYDSKNSDKMFYGRDPFGVRPLYKYENFSKETDNFYSIASELKVLSVLMGKEVKNNIYQVKPGTFTELKNIHSQWKITNRDERYFSINYHTNVLQDISSGNHAIIDVCRKIYNNLVNSVKKRVVGTTDRPIACLLSGGLDSSLIASIASKYVPELHTFSIGMSGSKDLEYAKVVAKHINSVHHEIILSKDEFFDAIPEVIYNIESYDTTSVRASVGNFLIGKYISTNFPHKVILNGDGSDELTGGYIYMLHTPNDVEFDNECKRLLEDIHYFDVLRSDRSISSNGLEPRTPFLDKTFVCEYLNIPASFRNPRSSYNIHCKLWDKHASYYDSKGLNKIADIIRSRPEKLLLRYAIDSIENSLLPPEILWRSKEAFSDGVSGAGESWYQVISNKLSSYEKERKVDNSRREELHPLLDNLLPFNFETNSSFTDWIYLIGGENVIHNHPRTVEQLYYRKLFCNFFPNTDKSIPYFWMPKYVGATDSSARTLAHYNSNN